MALSSAATSRRTGSRMTKACGPGCSTWPDSYGLQGPEWRSRFRLSPNPASAARAGCEGIADRLRYEGDFRHSLNLLQLECKVVDVMADVPGNPDIVERLVPTEIKLLH